MNRVTLLLSATGSAALLAAGLLPGAASATPGATVASFTGTDTPDPDAPVTGRVSGALRGTAAARAAGEAADTFRVLRRRMADTDGDTRGPSASLRVHTYWGTFTHAGSAYGEMATQSVIPELDVSGPEGFLYAPTMKPAGGSCIEVVTAYTPDLGNAVWAWDWCGSVSPEVVMPIDSDFLDTYTTTVSGHPAYTVRIVRTDASSNTWTASLYNYQRDGWDELFTSSGTDESGQSRGWNIFEIYASRDPSTGEGYYCADTMGEAFESSGIRIRTDSGWVPTTEANSVIRPTSDPNPSDYLCPSLRFRLPSANDHWVVSNGTARQPRQPVARFTARCSSSRPSCSFDASASTDPDGSVTAYTWEFGDGTGGSGVSTSHTYAEAGNYAVTLTVTDEDGNTDSVTRTVTAGDTGDDEPPTECPDPGQKLDNPGFESGASGWSGDTRVIHQWGRYGQPPHSGAWNAWLAGYGRRSSEHLGQRVSLPAGCSTYALSFWLNIDTEEYSRTTAYDTLEVQVVSPDGSTVLGTLATYSNVDATSGGYREHTVSLAEYAGETIRIRFHSREDAYLATSFVLDDTALSVS